MSEASQTWPLGPEQRACLRADGSAPTLAIEVALAGTPDPERLARALDAVAARHEILGVAFAAAPGYRGLRQSRAGEPVRVPLDPVAALDDAAGRIDPARGRTLSAALAAAPDGTSRLRLTASALAADRGSLAAILAELGDADAAAASPAPDPEAVTYVQFAAWREDVAADDPAGEARGYWQDAVGADEAPLRLPYRRAGAEGVSARAIGQRRRVEPALAEAFAAALDRPALRAAGAEAVLQAAWWLLLGRIAGRTSFVAGWHHDCRRDYEAFAGIVGVFEKTLPLPVTLGADTSVAELACTIAARLDAHRGFQEHWPLDAPGGHRAVGFALAPVIRSPAGWAPGVMEAPEGFELCIAPSLDAQGRLVALAAGAAGEAYDDDALSALLDQYETVLAALPDQAEAAFGDLVLTGAAERARLLAFGRPGPRALPAAMLPALAARHALDTPGAPALSGGGTSLTWAELEDRVAALGAWLAARGVGPERIVALDMARSPDLVVAILATWRAGGAYLTLDPSWPRARRDDLVAFARPVLTLHDGEPRSDDRCHRFGEAAAAAAGERLGDAGQAGPGRMASVLFTSGSTGAPKGVVIEHGQILAYTEAVVDALGLGRCRRFGLTSTVAADLGNTMLFSALRLGACLAVADEADMADGTAFSAFLHGEGVDCAKLAPSHLAALIESGAALLPGTLILGGEATRPALLDRVRSLAPDTRIANHYGPTETCVGVLVHPVDPAEAALGDGLPLTRTLDGSEVYILDGRGGLAPTGTCGLLHVGGAQLCRGYLPAAGAEAATPFVANPFGPGPLYPTGDRARYRPGGGLVLAGRADDQVKVRGFRVEPGEVEAVLAGLGGVRQAALRAFPSEEGGARLAAYVVAEPGHDAASLGSALAERLPAPMRPAAILVLDALPRLPNGKVDRAALPEPVAAGAGVAPRNALEAVLADTMAELLDRPAGAVGATDDFFDAGGHSLLVIKLTARIRKLFHVEVPPGIVFDARSPEALARALGAYAAPEALEDKAALRLELAALSEAERTALLDRPVHPREVME